MSRSAAAASQYLWQINRLWRCIIIADNLPPFRYNASMPSVEKLVKFVAWRRQHLAGDEKGKAQIFLDHLFHALGWTGSLKEAGATPAESRVLIGGLFSATVSIP